MPVRLLRLLAILLTLCAGSVFARDFLDWRTTEVASISATSLPAEARETLALIHQGGPYPYRRDGIVFQNREGRLPGATRGYYREFTVATPGSRDRGARRIISGGQPPEVFYYSDDHYRSFRRIRE
ncbi:MAG TPA: ribonuclease domain-containing protein [Zoogloea sp.]|jgi:ribonuclease T1|uniref:ribonuclease domain-containing protein n=1 Tax=Zoogloea sp. TaxID=49181 RepID=UPI002B8308F2|nr:ribonuclease domain-containing protein [Zoogloea sp.]HOB47423.1 ribonuclease domain-containing protein [Zoogloea sp.]HQA12057.1 ribonuclease domain-containing protein [Zoogloea sp.]HQE40898.1 ribonuclease domain-containing protein [Zoogloea sp.]